jgi:putative polyhydroxyalkanoate system protein
MKKISIEKSHSLSSEECQRLIKSLSEQLTQQFGGKTFPEDGAMHYQHSSGTRGVLNYNDERILIEVTVPFLMRPLAYKIEEEIHSHCEQYL